MKRRYPIELARALLDAAGTRERRGSLLPVIWPGSGPVLADVDDTPDIVDRLPVEFVVDAIDQLSDTAVVRVAAGSRPAPARAARRELEARGLLPASTAPARDLDMILSASPFHVHRALHQLRVAKIPVIVDIAGRLVAAAPDGALRDKLVTDRLEQLLIPGAVSVDGWVVLLPHVARSVQTAVFGTVELPVATVVEVTATAPYDERFALLSGCPNDLAVAAALEQTAAALAGSDRPGDELIAGRFADLTLSDRASLLVVNTARPYQMMTWAAEQRTVLSSPVVLAAAVRRYVTWFAARVAKPFGCADFPQDAVTDMSRPMYAAIVGLVPGPVLRQLFDEGRQERRRGVLVGVADRLVGALTDPAAVQIALTLLGDGVGLDDAIDAAHHLTGGD